MLQSPSQRPFLEQAEEQMNNLISTGFYRVSKAEICHENRLSAVNEWSTKDWMHITP